MWGSLFSLKWDKGPEDFYICVTYFNLYHSLGKFSRHQIGNIFFTSTKIRNDILHEISNPISPNETIYMKCQILFSGKIKNFFLKMSSAEIFKKHAKHNKNIKFSVEFALRTLNYVKDLEDFLCL